MTLSTPTSCLDWNKYCLDLKKHWKCRACTFIILHTVLCHLSSAPSLANGLTMQVCTRGHRAVGFGTGAGFITRCIPQERAYIWRSAEELQSAMKTFSPRHLLMSSMLRARLPSGSLLKDQIWSVHGVISVLIGHQLQHCLSNLQQWARTDLWSSCVWSFSAHSANWCSPRNTHTQKEKWWCNPHAKANPWNPCHWKCSCTSYILFCPEYAL